MTQKQTKTGELRQFLFDTMKKAQQGEIPAHDGRNIVGMANQINLSMQAELKRQRLAVELGHKVESFGDLALS
jgi:hypothetical protein